MKCEDVRLVLQREQADTATDGEASVERDAKAHYEACASCQRALAVQWALARRVRRAAETTVAPSSLRSQVVRALREETGAENVVEFPKRKTAWRWAGAAVVAAAASLLFFVTSRSPEPSLGPALVRLAEPATSPDSVIVSSDFDELGAWLTLRVGYEVQVPAITNAIPTAAHVAQVAGVNAAAIRFDLPGGSLTYFAFPVSEDAAEQNQVETLMADGHNVATWTEYGAPRAVVARLPREDVLAIAEECRNMALKPAAL